MNQYLLTHKLECILPDDILISIFSYLTIPRLAWVRKTNNRIRHVNIPSYYYSGIDGTRIYCHAVGPVGYSYDKSIFKCIGIVFEFIDRFPNSFDWGFPNSFDWGFPNSFDWRIYTSQGLVGDEKKLQNKYRLNTQWQHRQIQRKFINLWFSLM
jgi:hypothetical protein